MLECTKCGWVGYCSDLVCSDEDFNSDKSVSETKFDLCPECGGKEFDEFEEE